MSSTGNAVEGSQRLSFTISCKTVKKTQPIFLLQYYVSIMLIVATCFGSLQSHLYYTINIPGLAITISIVVCIQHLQRQENAFRLAKKQNSGCAAPPHPYHLTDHAPFDLFGSHG
jgi:hypothetical protein